MGADSEHTAAARPSAPNGVTLSHQSTGRSKTLLLGKDADKFRTARLTGAVPTASRCLRASWPIATTSAS